MELIKTTNWDDFCFFYENRSKITRSKFLKLLKAIESTGYIICPILVMPCRNEDRLINLDGNETEDVNHKYAVIDGQNRLLACRELGIDAVVVVNNNSNRDDIVVANNTATPWGISDYIKYYDKKGKPQYHLLHTLWNEYTSHGFTTSAIIETFIDPYMDGFGGAANAVKSGNYVVNEEFGRSVLDGCLVIEEVDGDLFRNTKFVRSMKKLYFNFDGFNVDIIAMAIDRGAEIEMPNDESAGMKILLEIYEKNLPSSEERHIPKVLRDWIYFRDKGICQHEECNETENLHVDHMKAYSRWGMTEAANLQLLCEKHNKMKSNKDID